MAIEIHPLPLPPSVDPTRFGSEFGREVRGLSPGRLTEEQFKEISNLLYKHGALLFRDTDLTPEQQYALTKAFDPSCENYGHGNNKTESDTKSILHSLLKTIPRVPQVQLVGNGTIYNHEGIVEAKLKHPSHVTHKTQVSSEDAEAGATRYTRWHMDAALYDLSPPRVTTLYSIQVPEGPPQVCHYDDGMGDELPVPLAATTFVSGKTMFEILPKELKSIAVRTHVKYAPHPFVWMASAGALSTGLGMETEGLESPLDKLPSWEESKIKVFPMLWKNPVTGNLHFQVHPCAALELLIAPLPEGANKEGAVYADGAHLKDLREVRGLLYKMQRPGIAPALVYPHDWRPKDLILFHNRGVMHSAVGTLKPDQVRLFHQCNLAASDDPVGPDAKDIGKWA
ncbi:hypothetical protein M0805_007092 [Coniferiporia weirii]|nr:hypothetical protein M0805_007092 [Coniferiporia weirii]